MLHDAMSLNAENEKALQDFLLDIDCLDELIPWVAKFNIFDVLKISRTEIRHSNVLAWLLDANENHGLGDMFIREIMQTLVEEDDSSKYDVFRLLLLDFHSFTVYREWNNIDIMLLSDEEKVVIAFENKVGSHECEDGKIFIEPQGFCVLAGVGIKEGHANKALASVEKILDTKYGIVLLQPAYKDYHLELGEVSSYPPGYKENAGIFCHNNPWISIAETCVGHGNRAFDVYRKICPAYIENISEIHRTEPYVYSQMIAGKDAKNFGEAKNSWLTGTAAWTFLNVSQAILGIQPDYDGLVVDPCIPSELSGFTITRKFRDVTYTIEVQNPNKSQKGISKLIVDGVTVDGNQIPYDASKKQVHVVAVLDA